MAGRAPPAVNIKEPERTAQKMLGKWMNKNKGCEQDAQDPRGEISVLQEGHRALPQGVAPERTCKGGGGKEGSKKELAIT